MVSAWERVRVRATAGPRFAFTTASAYTRSMRCRVCREPAGWWRRSCTGCRQLIAVYAAHPDADMSTLMELFIATGAAPAQVERFLDADLDGSGAVRDHIAASMTNQLMAALGQTARQSAADVRRIRDRGNWVTLDRRPET